MIKRGCLAVSVFLILVLTMLGNAESPYSVDFDLRNMAGFNDNTITAEDIVAYIQEKYPNSPLLVEEGIGDCFISAGQNNNVNPAFLVATAELEGRFGTAGWASNNLQCHNTMGYDISDSGPGEWSCVDSWCAMIQRVASVIAIGDNYYTQSRFTVSQVREKYATNPNSEAIAQYMNELYTFSLNRQTGGLDVPATDGSSTYEPQILNTTTPQCSGGSTPVTSVAFSPDGKKLVIAARYGLTSIWDVESGTKLAELDQSLYYNYGNAAFAFSPDGSKLAMGIDNDKTIDIWDVESGTKVQMMLGDSETRLIAFSPDGSKLITIDLYGTATLWDVKRGIVLQNVASGSSDVPSKAISPDGSKLAICSGADRTTCIWDVQSGTKLQELEHDHPVRFVAFDFDGSKLVTECYLESEVRIWDVESGTKLQEFNISEDTPLAFSSDGSKLATDCYIRTMRQVLKEELSIWDVESGTKLQTLENFISPPCTDKGVAFSLDGSKLAIGGSDGYTRIWNVKESSWVSDQRSPTKQESSDTQDLPTTTREEESEEIPTNFDGTPASTEKSPLSISIGAISLITAVLFIKSKRDRL